MIFVYHAAIAAIATFVSALAGFGAHSVLPAAYVVESKGMVGSVVGLVASLLSLVLSPLAIRLVRVDRGDRQCYGGPRRNQSPHGDRETTDTLACLKSFVDEDGGEREGHFRATDTPWAPWHVIRSDDKKRPQLNTISHLFTQIP